MTKHAHSPTASGPAAASLRRVMMFGLGLIALIALVHPDALFSGKIYSNVDGANYDAFSLVGDVSRLAGDYPEWNPLLFAGMPTFGSLAYRWGVYPLTIVMNWLQNSLGFPPLTWMLLHLLFGGAGMVWLLGRWQLPASSRLLAAAMWLLFPRIVAWGVHGHGTKLVAAMYLPWLVGLAFDALDDRGRKVAGWAALLLGLQVLRGHPQITYYSLLTLGLILLSGWVVALIRRRETYWPVSGTLWGVAAVVVAMMIGAVSWLPIHDYAEWSVRGVSEAGGASYEYATGWSLSLRELGTFVFPSSAGFGLATYQGAMPFTDYPNTFGFVALALACAAFWDRRRRSVVITFGALFFLSVLISFGDQFPVLYRPLFNWLPYFNKFRIPSMILVLSALAVAVTSGFGLRQLTDPQCFPASRLRLFGLVCGGASLLTVVAALGLGESWLANQLTAMAAASGRPAPALVLLEQAWDLHRADLWRLAFVAAVASVGLVVASRSVWWRTRGLGYLMLALLVFELMGVDIRITHPEQSLHRVARDASGRGQLVSAPQMVRSRPAGGTVKASPGHRQLAAALGHERVWPLGRDSASNDGMIAGVRSLGGYQAAKLAAFETLRGMLFDPEQPAARLASWLSAAKISVDRPLPAGAIPLLGRLGAELDSSPVVWGDLIVYSNRSALPRARLIHNWRRNDDDDLGTFLARIQSGDIAPALVATLDQAPEPMPQPSIGQQQPVAYISDDLDRVVLMARPSSPAILVLADMWQPGWDVQVDNQPATLLRVDHVLRGVALGSGEHEVCFTYKDPSLRRSLVVTMVGVLLTLVLLVMGARKGPMKDLNGNKSDEDRRMS